MDNTTHKWCKDYLIKEYNNELHKDYVVELKYYLRKFNKP